MVTSSGSTSMFELADTLTGLETTHAFLTAQCQVLAWILKQGEDAISNPNHPLSDKQSELSTKLAHARQVHTGILAINSSWQVHPAISSLKLDELLDCMPPKQLSDHLESMCKEFEGRWVELQASTRHTTIATSLKVEPLSDPADDSRAEMHKLAILINYLKGVLLHLPGGMIE